MLQLYYYLSEILVFLITGQPLLIAKKNTAANRFINRKYLMNSYFYIYGNNIFFDHFKEYNVHYR